MSKNSLYAILYIVLGLTLGVLGALSFFRTLWLSYHPDFFFWLSIVLAIISFVLTLISVWQLLEAQSQKRLAKAQVKIWMQDAHGGLFVSNWVGSA